MAECAVSASDGVSEIVVDAAPTFGSEDEVMEVMVTVAASGALVCAVASRAVAEICGGGNLVKKRRRRGWSFWASWICRSMAGGVYHLWCRASKERVRIDGAQKVSLIGLF